MTVEGWPVLSGTFWEQRCSSSQCSSGLSLGVCYHNTALPVPPLPREVSWSLHILQVLTAVGMGVGQVNL